MRAPYPASVLLTPEPAFSQVGTSIGNIVGPIVFDSKDAPLYHKGLASVLGVFVASGAVVIALVFLFAFLNKRKEAERVRNGKPAKLVDRSMDAKYVQADVSETGEEGAGGVHLGDQAFLDLTDKQNDEVSIGDGRGGVCVGCSCNRAAVHLHVLSGCTAGGEQDRALGTDEFGAVIGGTRCNMKRCQRYAEPFILEGWTQSATMHTSVVGRGDVKAVEAVQVSPPRPPVTHYVMPRHPRSKTHRLAFSVRLGPTEHLSTCTTLLTTLATSSTLYIISFNTSTPCTASSTRHKPRLRTSVHAHRLQPPTPGRARARRRRRASTAASTERGRRVR